MKEEYLHYVYDKRMLGDQFKTVDGRSIEVIDFGELNLDAGPDFLDAKLKIDGTVWAGAVEFHINASDWYRHQHQFDPAYEAVIAHFVLHYDRDVLVKFTPLPTVELKSLIDRNHLRQYENMIKAKSTILCESQFPKDKSDVIAEELIIKIRQRLWRKSINIIQCIESQNGDRKKGLLVAFARIFGGKVNAMPFELLVDQIEIKWLAKLNYDKFRVTALFLGLSGLIPENPYEQYVMDLKKEFDYQRRLFSIVPIPAASWKYSRMRPQNFPDRRIAQFALFVNQFLKMNQNIESIDEINHFKANFQLKLHPFWQSHYRLLNRSKQKLSVSLSGNLLNLLLINGVVPYIYSQGIWKGEDELTENAIRLLQTIPAEKNNLTKQWGELGFSAKTAFDSQALIELINLGCKQKNCLFCSIGKSILNATT